MANKQRIRTKTGFETVTLTPMRAIRKNCYECVGWSYSEVAKCQIDTCCFYSYRLGKRGDTRKIKSNDEIELVEDIL